MKNGLPTSLFDQAEEIFCRVMEAAAADRHGVLDAACRSNADLRREVERLLAAQPEVDRVFETMRPALQPTQEVLDALTADPALQASACAQGRPEEKLGTHIGHYRLQEVIGKGGCGVVYLAEQEKPVRRQVALKLIKLGMDTESVIARFASERQALAMMDHPGIARVFDAGATDDGRPYFVMEHVPGMRITEFCDRHRLALPERIDLFVQVCHAIQHAHHKGIIHRDIKPSNILVAFREGTPVPKVIDFGIAKSTQQRLGDTSLFTACGQLIGTPAYMSPEQADLRTLDIDTRSDLYSLGVLLYELLTGATPFDALTLARSGLDEMRRTVREVEPPSPAERLASLASGEAQRAAELRRMDRRRLLTLLRGDLGCIVMKALEKDRDDRYVTASAFAADIRHFRQNEPISARPHSRAYRLRKWIRRNRVLFGAGLSVFLALGIGFGVSAWMFLREKAARHDAEEARANETLLRAQAEIREKITRATVLLNQNRMAEADALAADLPVQLCPPYMEEVHVFRTLADWNATEQRWAATAARAVAAARLNRVDASDQSGAVTCDYMSAAAALLAVQDTAGYRELCRDARARFATTASPVAAEQIIKVNLLLPASPELLAELEPMVRVAADSVPEQARAHPTTVEAWCLMSLALFEYRRGHYEEATAMARSAVLPNDAPARHATCQLIVAMSAHQLRQRALAAQELATARKTIEDRFTKPLNAGAMDTWYSWLTAQALLREATALISGN